MANAKKTGSSSPRTFYWIIGIVAVLGVGAIALATMRGGSAMVTEPLDLGEIADASTLLERAQGITVGADDAPIKLLVFSDFQCPACRVWALSVEKPLKAEFVESGQAQLVYFDYPLAMHPHAFVVARAARCAADQDKFWEYHDLAFAQQDTWAFSAGTPGALLEEYAGTVGMDQAQFEQCLNSDAHAETVTANQMLGTQLGVRGTPTVFVNGRQLQNWQEYEAAKEEILRITGGATGG
ncbi:MAG: DsbA family protein [Longimicrobiales bacterium]